jgi:hypothetical protein
MILQFVRSATTLARGGFHAAPPKRSTNALISSAFHATERAPNFTGLGNFPDFTPSNHDVLLMGISGCIGGFDFGLPMMAGNLIKPISGICLVVFGIF